MLISAFAFTDGSFSTEDIEHILKQNPGLRAFLFEHMCISTSGLAKRIGSNVNERMGGRRIGPYELRGKPKGSTGPYIYKVVIHTLQKFVDKHGNATDLPLAVDVKETFDSVEISETKDRLTINSYNCNVESRGSERK